MPKETVRDYLARVYPLHFQRILERWNEQRGWGESGMTSPAGQNELASCFTWTITKEGHDYWSRLSRAESLDLCSERIAAE